jgi:hypothetical protein
MTNAFTKALAVAAVAGGLVAGGISSASAAIIGSANYFYTIGSFDFAGTPDLDLKLDGSTIYTVANANSAKGTSISLATAAPSAFAALVAVLRNNAPNNITTEGLNVGTMIGSVTVSDFDYSLPNTDDLQGVGTIVDIILTINQFGTVSTPFPPASTAFVSTYDIDIDVEAIPLPGTLVSAASGLALVGFMAYRRKRSS